MWRPTRDAQGRVDPLRSRTYAWWLRFECFGMGLVQNANYGPKTLEITPYASKVLEIWPEKEYTVQYFRTLNDGKVHTELHILS